MLDPSAIDAFLLGVDVSDNENVDANSLSLSGTAVDANGSDASEVFTATLGHQNVNSPETTSVSRGVYDSDDGDTVTDDRALARANHVREVATIFAGDTTLASVGTEPASIETIAPLPSAGITGNFTTFTLNSAAIYDTTSTPTLAMIDVASQPLFTADATAAVTILDGTTVHVNDISTQSIIFTGMTGTAQFANAVDFTGYVAGLAGSDALDLSDVAFGPNTTATFLGNTSGGTLTVSDGTNTANITLVGNYLSSNWDLSSDANGGTIVVDPVSPNNWRALNVGAGGFADGLDIAPDGTMVARTDSYGAYIWNGTEWQQLVTSTSMPASFMTPDNLINAAQGVYEIQIAPSNSNIMYMMFDGDVLKSTNKGTTWTQTSFAQVTEEPNDGYRMYGQKMAVDPNNSNIVYVGTPLNGLYVSTDGGATWNTVNAIPVSKLDSGGNSAGITGIEFDTALGATGGHTNTVFASSAGNGVYESTNGGATWSSIGGPNQVVYASVSSTGVYYATDGTSLWSYAGGTWTQLVSNGANSIETIAVDPSNPNEIVALNVGGSLDISYNGGVTWSGVDWSSQVSSTDVPWLANANISTSTGAPFLDAGGLAFNPLNPNELVLSAGTGVWTTNLPQNLVWTTPVTWNDQSAGLEQLVTNDIIVPLGGHPVLASWDRPFFYIANPEAYPSTYGPIASSNIVAGWSLDYASSDPSFVVGIADNWGTEESGYSTNGGQTWIPFASYAPVANVTIGGTIAASTPENIIWAPADSSQPYYTLDGGNTWNPITLPGVSSWSGFDFAYYLDTRTVTADRVLPNTFYLYYAGNGVYETTNGGVTWTEVHAGSVSPSDYANAEIQSVPGEAGNLFFTAGPQSGVQPDGISFYQSTNQGTTWTAVPNVQDVATFGFGAPAPGQSYPSIYIVGWVNNVYGIWQSINDAQSWTQIGTYPTDSLDNIRTISGDPSIYGQVYVGFAGSGYAYLPGGPVITGITSSPSSGVEYPSDTITLTLTMNEVVTVTGTPTLSLNDGATATFSGGSGTGELTFSYTVSASDSAVSGLAITQVNEPNGATITDGNGNAASLSVTGLPQAGPRIVPPNSLALDGNGFSNASAASNSASVTLTTAVNNDVIILGIEENGTTVGVISDTAGLTWHMRAVAGSSPNLIYEYYAIAPTALAGDVITVGFSGAASYATLNAFGISGANTSSPFDTNVSLAATSANSTVSVTTSNANDLIFADYRLAPANPSSGSGWTGIASGDYYLSEYQIVAATQTGLVATVSNGGQTINGGIVDAVVQATGSVVQGPGPTVSSIAETPSSGVLNAGKTVTYTLTMSETVTVNTTGGSADAFAQRRWHRHLCQRLRHQFAGVQLHGTGRSEHPRL